MGSAAKSDNGRVLVVDDERNIADVLAIALRYNDYEVEIATDGRGALKAASEFRPDLIVLDVMLPDIDGFEIGGVSGEAKDSSIAA